MVDEWFEDWKVIPSKSQLETVSPKKFKFETKHEDMREVHQIGKREEIYEDDEVDGWVEARITENSFQSDEEFYEMYELED